MGGGVPISGVIREKDIMDLPEIGNMSSTHSANPLVCSAVLAVLDEIKRRDLVNESKIKGALMKKALIEIKNKFKDRVSYVFGEGLIAAILFKIPGTNEPDGFFASKVSERCMQKGLLVVHTGRESY